MKIWNARWHSLKYTTNVYIYIYMGLCFHAHIKFESANTGEHGIRNGGEAITHYIANGNPAEVEIDTVDRWPVRCSDKQRSAQISYRPPDSWVTRHACLGLGEVHDENPSARQATAASLNDRNRCRRARQAVKPPMWHTDTYRLYTNRRHISLDNSDNRWAV